MGSDRGWQPADAFKTEFAKVMSYLQLVVFFLTDIHKNP